MPRKGENIYKRKDGRWEGRYIGCYDENHKAKYVYIYGKTYTEVKQKLAIERGRQKQHVPAEKKQITYGEVLDLWLHSTKTSIKESTYARYAHLINSHIKPQLGDYKLSMLSTEIIENFIENQLVEGQLDRTGGLAPKTVIDLLAIVKSTIGYAQYKGFPVICNLSRLSVKRKDKEMRVLTPSERESLIGILMEDMDSFKFGVFLALYTGIRIGELCALQWKDIDFARATLKVRKTIQRIQNIDRQAVSKTKIVISEPKSKCSIREIPLSVSVMDIAQNFISYPESYVLTGTSRYIEPRTMQNHFKLYVKQSGISDANFHALRHPCCSVYPRTAARQIRSYGSSAENPSAPAIGAQYLNVSPIMETLVFALEEAAAVTGRNFLPTFSTEDPMFWSFSPASSILARVAFWMPFASPPPFGHKKSPADSQNHRLSRWLE